jgi:hypothetical protein
VVGVFLPQPSGKVLRWLAAACALLLVFLVANATDVSSLRAFPVEVIEVVNGSTVRVCAGGREEIVRLIGVGDTEAQPQGQ